MSYWVYIVHEEKLYLQEETFMAMIKCPECGQEISDKAKKCVNCGKILIEETVPVKYCAECGKEIEIDSQECPFCGCPVVPEKKDNATIIKINSKVKKFKLPIIITAAILIVAAITLGVFQYIGSLLSEDEQIAYQSAVVMKNRMRDPDSFRLYDEMFLLKWSIDGEENPRTYCVFKYGGANGYGAITTNEAIFQDGEYIGNYSEELDEDDSNYINLLIFNSAISLYALGDDDFEMVEIDINKIKNKMGLE